MATEHKIQIKPINDECPICMESPKKGQIVFECNHLVCMKCFMKYIQKYDNCPLCRKKFPPLEMSRPTATYIGARRSIHPQNQPRRIARNTPVHNNNNDINNNNNNEDDEISPDSFIEPLTEIFRTLVEIMQPPLPITTQPQNAQGRNNSLRNAQQLRSQRYNQSIIEIYNNIPAREDNEDQEHANCSPIIFWGGVIMDLVLMVSYVWWHM